MCAAVIIITVVKGMRQQMPARPPFSQAGNQLPSAPTHHQHHMFKCPYDTLCLVGGSVCPSVCIHERSTYCSCMLRTFHVLNVCLLFSLCTYTHTHRQTTFTTDQIENNDDNDVQTSESGTDNSMLRVKKPLLSTYDDYTVRTGHHHGVAGQYKQVAIRL